MFLQEDRCRLNLYELSSSPSAAEPRAFIDGYVKVPSSYISSSRLEALLL